MPAPPTDAIVIEQIQGLKRTQSPEVTVRKDILDYALGEKETKKLTLASVVMATRKSKHRRLIDAKKDLEKYGPTDSAAMVTVDREATLEALMGYVEANQPTNQPKEVLDDPDDQI